MALLTIKETSDVLGMSLKSVEDLMNSDKNGTKFKSKMIGGGEETSLELDTSVFTSENEYIFICSFPGHFALMKGKLNI